MKENNEINSKFVEPLGSVIGQELKQIRAQDDLKYWELEFGDGQVLYFDTMNHGGFFGRVVANVQDEPTAESAQVKPAEAALEAQAGSGSAPSPCSGLGVGIR